jgi:Fe-S cluster assembly iron-binding protein IscA
VVEAIRTIKLEPGVSQVIKSWLADKGIQKPVRIDLNFSGCCDSSLCLRVDNISETDFTLEKDGLIFVISPETYELVGEVTVSYVDETERKGFRLTSSKPVGEWDGFGVSDIKI